jgi:hypothetical protein
MLNVVMLNVFILNVVMMSDVAPPTTLGKAIAKEQIVDQG